MLGNTKHIENFVYHRWFLKKTFLRCYAHVILNKVKELCSISLTKFLYPLYKASLRESSFSYRQSKILLRTTKVPHLLKGRFRDDIYFKFKLIFFKSAMHVSSWTADRQCRTMRWSTIIFSPPRLHRPLITVSPALVSSYRLRMVLFCLSERIHPGGLQKKN